MSLEIVLSHLICGSLAEDRYGVVQRDIPRILEAMLSFLIAIEKYQATVKSLIQASSPEDELTQEELRAQELKRIEVDKADEVLSLVGDG